MQIVCKACIVGLPLAVIGIAGCTRSYDGTIVPRYTAQMDPAASMTGIVYRQSDLQPRSRLVKFPPQPPAPAAFTPETTDRPVKRRAGRLLPRIEGDLPRKISCSNVAGADGRIRMVCL